LQRVREWHRDFNRAIITSMDQFFISSPLGTEELLLSELEQAGVSVRNKANGGAYCKTRPLLALELLLTSRVASRIYRELSKFSISNEQELLLKSTNWPWESLFTLDQTFKVESSFDREAKRRFRNTLLLSQKLKDGIVDHFRGKYGSRPNVDTKQPDITIFMRIEQSTHNERRFTVRILQDLSGSPLSNRGYRRAIVHQAPLRENLAAAIIMLSNWKKDQEPLVDSMCGSATMLIEAALIKYNIPPSYLMIQEFLEENKGPWSFLNHLWFTQDSALKTGFDLLVKRLNQQTIRGLASAKPGTFFGYDNSVPSLKIARDATNRAKISHIIALKKECATKLHPPSGKPCTIVCNPPYGERLGRDDELAHLYHQYGENLKQSFRGSTAYILISNSQLRKKISLQTKRRIPLLNGGLECRLCEYLLF
jgi:putative N6-adenine-specific DNA methylase